ncbi:hypothetical protein KDL01_34070 [Actinospica durhamensis]|uniref:Uncharacterized protein n=1 Tax=Actinospica durhamensis TaxID=1508375 RepID=A0A941ITZ9_9ACTN|nr:hypothetical protein [Actinospica durhamensis]MBR7838347.1 hypothetical protein [Actinospica durhamensis]
MTAVAAVAALATVGVVVSNSGRHGDSVVKAVACAPATLASCLIKAPAGAIQLGFDSGWDQTTAPSVDGYASNITGDAKGMTSDTSNEVGGDGESGLVHADWNAVDGDNVDLVLLEFATLKGAQAWNDTRSAEILAAYPGQSAGIPGDSTGAAHAGAKPDSRGDFDAAYSTVVGDLVLNVAYSSPNQLETADLRNWVGTELASLHSAPAPAADAPAPAPGMEEVACENLRACLPSRPSGDVPWAWSYKSSWVSASTLTPAQFGKIWWQPNAQIAVQGAFNLADMTGVVHTSWANADDSQQADVYIAQALTEEGASFVYSRDFGEPQWGAGLKGISYAIPGEPEAQAWYTNKTDSHGLTQFTFIDQIGNVVVHAWFYFAGSLNKTLANAWAKTITDRVKASAHQVDLGLPSLAAPAIKTVAQGTCPTSDNCLAPLPAGASDTTSKSLYEANTSVSATTYATEYDTLYGLQYGTWLTADGFQSAEHREWSAKSGATADAVVLKFGSAAQAKASATIEYGLSDEAERSCTVSAAADTLCLAEPVSTSDYYQTETVQVLAWKGDYEVRVTVAISDRADLAEAYAWAEQQLALLPAA